jgi:hypothetical protein
LASAVIIAGCSKTALQNRPLHFIYLVKGLLLMNLQTTMRQIKNTELLLGVDELTIISMEIAALIHTTQENIRFKIVAYDDEKIVIQAVQSKTAAGFYHTQKTLIDLVHKTFDSFFISKKVLVHPIPFVEHAPAKVDIKWINKKMLEMGIRINDIATDTGIGHKELTELLNSDIQLSKATKALFYYYFLAKEQRY